MMHLFDCVNKGCISDCRPFKDCYILESRRPVSGLADWLKKTESVKNEAWHRIANLLKAEVKARNLVIFFYFTLFRPPLSQWPFFFLAFSNKMISRPLPLHYS